MSYEGHFYKICREGHVNSYGVYGDHVDNVCPDCSRPWQTDQDGGDLEFHVDETNGIPYCVDFKFIQKSPRHNQAEPTYTVEYLAEVIWIDKTSQIFVNH